MNMLVATTTSDLPANQFPLYITGGSSPGAAVTASNGIGNEFVQQLDSTLQQSPV